MHIILIPLLAAVCQALSLLFDRFTIKRLHIGFRAYSFWAFLYLTILTIIFQPILGGVNWGLLSIHWPILLAILVIAPSWNYFFFKAIQHEKAMYVESISSLAPLFSIVGSWLLVPSGFRLSTAVAIAVACGFLLWGYTKRHRFVIDRYMLLLILAMGLSAAENLLIYRLLDAHAIAPATLFLMRVMVMAGFFGVLAVRFGRLRIGVRAQVYTVAAGFVSATMMIARFYGFRDSGVVVTSVVLLLAPALVYKGSALFLREKISRHQVYAFVGMITAIALAVFFNAH